LRRRTISKDCGISQPHGKGPDELAGSERWRARVHEVVICADWLHKPASAGENPIPARQRRPRLRLDPESYAALRQRVLQRDGWRCQRCGSLQNLEVHHVRSRSKLGDDVAMRDFRPYPWYACRNKPASGSISATTFTKAPRNPPKKITHSQDPSGRRRKKCTNATKGACTGRN